MSSVIQNILDKTLGDAGRSSKFECLINFGNNPNFPSSEDVAYMVKTSQFPGKSHDVIDFKFKGRTIPIKGQTKYDNTWTCTFYATENHSLKHEIEKWIESIDQKHNMPKVSSDVDVLQLINNTSGYGSDMKIIQLDFDGRNPTIEYELKHVFPKSVSSIDADYSATGTIEEFTVEFSYAYYNTKVLV